MRMCERKWGGGGGEMYEPTDIKIFYILFYLKTKQKERMKTCHDATIVTRLLLNANIHMTGSCDNIMLDFL